MHKSLGIRTEIKDNIMSFSISKPSNLSVNIYGSINHPFSIFERYNENHLIEKVSIENLLAVDEKIKDIGGAKIVQEFSRGIKIK